MQFTSAALVQVQVSTVKQILDHPLCLVHPFAYVCTWNMSSTRRSTSTKGFHSNAKLLYLLMIVVDILGLEHTLTERFIKIKRIWETPSDHITNISSVNSVQSHLAFSTTLCLIFFEIPTSTLHQHATCWRRKGSKHTWTLGDMNKDLTLTSNFKRHKANAKF